jgi:hypothetical protein
MIEVLVGPIASGKSAYARHHQTKFVPPTQSEGFDLVLPYQIGMQVATLNLSHKEQ